MRLASAEEVAEALGVHWGTVSFWARSGRIPYVTGKRTGKRKGRPGRLFDIADVRRALARGPVSAGVVAGRYEVRPETVLRWAGKGWIPSISHGKQTRFVLADVEAALQSRAADKQARGGCTICRRILPVAAFPPSDTSRSNCRECRRVQKREARLRAGGMSLADFRAKQAAEGEARRRTAQERAKERKRKAAEERADRAAERKRRRMHGGVCTVCGEKKAARAFYPSTLARYEQLLVCRRCYSERDRAKFQRDKEDLSDAYVKRQLAKQTGLSCRDIPDVLVEAKRAQLALKRIVAPRRGRGSK